MPDRLIPTAGQRVILARDGETRDGLAGPVQPGTPARDGLPARLGTFAVAWLDGDGVPLGEMWSSEFSEDGAPLHGHRWAIVALL